MLSLYFKINWGSTNLVNLIDLLLYEFKKVKRGTSWSQRSSIEECLVLSHNH